MVQIQPSKHALDHAEHTGPIRQHELDGTRSGIDLPCLVDLDHEL